VGFPTSYGKKMDFLAPGAKLLVSTTKDSSDHDTTFFNSSCAAPHVAGIAALMLSHYNPGKPTASNLSPEDLKNGEGCYGRAMYHGNISINSYPPGLYFIRIRDGNGWRTEKVEFFD
jgi:subtilisin family serine protease